MYLLKNYGQSFVVWYVLSVISYFLCLYLHVCVNKTIRQRETLDHSPLPPPPSNLEMSCKTLASSTAQQMAKSLVLIKIAFKESPSLPVLCNHFRVTYPLNVLFLLIVNEKMLDSHLRREI